MGKKISDFMRINIGIALLRIIMTYEVVLCHFYSFDRASGFSKIASAYKNIAVPVFMILAFCFTDIKVLSSDNGKIKKRLERLLVPHLVWSFMYFVIYWVVDRINNYSLGIHRGIKGFIGMLFTGNMLNPAAWFMVDLIIITVFFLIIYRLLGERRAEVLLVILFFITIFLQYSGLWFGFIGRVLDRNVLYWPVGRLLEMMPLAIAGIALNKVDLLGRIKIMSGVYRAVLMLVSAGALYIMIRASGKGFLHLGNDFMYGGVDRMIISLLTIIVFGCISFENAPVMIYEFIVKLSKHTLAVYYMHNMIGVIIFKAGSISFLKMESDTAIASLIICAICFGIASFAYRIPSKIVKMSMS